MNTIELVVWISVIAAIGVTILVFYLKKLDLDLKSNIVIILGVGAYFYFFHGSFDSRHLLTSLIKYLIVFLLCIWLLYDMTCNANGDRKLKKILKVINSSKDKNIINALKEFFVKDTEIELLNFYIEEKADWLIQVSKGKDVGNFDFTTTFHSRDLTKDQINRLSLLSWEPFCDEELEGFECSLEIFKDDLASLTKASELIYKTFEIVTFSSNQKIMVNFG